MRILGFSRKWAKLQKPTHTTFRYPRKDKDWYEGELVQEVYKPRSKDREFLQNATIVRIEPRQLADITHNEAVEDGFINLYAMFEFIGKNKSEDFHRPINKLTLKVESKWN